jgi:DNA topoisomerase I
LTICPDPFTLYRYMPATPKPKAKPAPKAPAKKASAAKPAVKKPTKASTASKASPKATSTSTAKKAVKMTEGALALVIVESPAKAKTLKKILGSNFTIKASVGHIRDLPEKKLGVDVAHNFEPQYEIMTKKAEVVQDLRDAAALCSKIYLAADPDREGEAIAWHTAAILADVVDPSCMQRIEFHEITATAILEAIENPREINLARVNAQQTRRILDRLVGYKLSPLLWAKVTKGLSAGRVQSVAVRLICEREALVQAFVPQEYWSVHADLSQAKTSPGFTADLVKVDGKKPELPNQAVTDALVSSIKAAPFTVSAVTDKESRRNALPPFITSTLQREASTRFGYPVKKTMQIAQKLYEGMDLGPFGVAGLITYMRTDSTRVADEAQAEAKDFILATYGADHYPAVPKVYAKKGKNVQDGHEAIRPTSVLRTPEKVAAYLTDEQNRIYRIIWERFVASQMEAAKLKTRTVEVTAKHATFRTSHSIVVFAGFLAVYKPDAESQADHEDKPDDTAHETLQGSAVGKLLATLEKGMVLTLLKLDPRQHFTEPPPRFNEASLVKTLEELGIGRPSTYAATITTVQDRGYVIKPDKALIPTEVGKVVNKLLVEHFPDILDVQFTANMEGKLDDIAEDTLQWRTVLKDFYEPFEATLTKASKEMGKVNVLVEGENCPDCGKPMAIKNSRWGSQFLACTGYPECKKTKPLGKDQQPVPDDKPCDEVCHLCNGSMVIRTGRFGEYFACANTVPNPASDTDLCKGRRAIVIKTGVMCPACDEGDIVQKKSFRGKIFFGCHTYPKCSFSLWNKPTGNKCPDCDSLLVEKILKKGTFHACSSKECKYVREVELAV